MKEKLKKNSENLKKMNYASNKAITLISLIIYITVMFVVLAAITRIILHFRSNMVEVADVTFETEFEKFNLYFLDETKKTGNSITEISEDKKEITFVTSNKYSYDNEKKTIYLNNSVKICEQVENCTFAENSLNNGKTQITVSLKIGNTEKEVNYIMNNVEQSSNIYEVAYVWDEYRRNLPVYSKTLLNEQGVLTVNAKYTDGENVAVIPKGFKISDIKTETIIENGLVIKDENENEFVWVPVEDGALNRTEWEDNKPTEIVSEEYTETLPEELKNSVEKYKGFYIGRYEAGCENPRTSDEDELTEVLVKKGLYPYNYINYDNAISKIEEMYTDKIMYGVEAILPYGAIWDETLRFVKDANHDVTNSVKWGNYVNNTFEFSGSYYDTNEWSEEVTNETKPEKVSWVLTTGASEVNEAKNIYDLAGNLSELTMEFNGRFNCVNRGGRYNNDGKTHPASCRVGSYFYKYSYNFLGFRPALYVTLDV